MPLERVAFATVVALFVLGVLHKPVQWDWVFDSEYLLAAGYLALPAAPRSPANIAAAGGGFLAGRLRLLVALYLLIDSSLQTLVALCFPSWRIAVFAGLVACYARVVDLHLQSEGHALRDLTPSRLLQAPNRLLTASIAVPLVCLYLPMLHRDYGFTGWSGPFVVYHPGTVHMDAGHPVHIGGNVILRGIEAAFSRVAALALASALALHLAHLHGYVAQGTLRRYLQFAVVVAALWWLVPARGLQSLRQPADLLFVLALGFFAAQVFRRGPAAPA